MKILITNDNQSAHMWIRQGLANALTLAGHECYMWNMWDGQSTLDVFNKFEPDLVKTQTYNIDEAMTIAIEKRPHLKVIAKAPDFGPLTEKVKDEYPVLYLDSESGVTLDKIVQETGRPDVLCVHYPEQFLDDTHGYYREKGYKVVSFMGAADITRYSNPNMDSRLRCNLAFIGGYWPYKAKVLDRYLIPLCRNYKYNVKIFGNSRWPVPQYCGFLPLEKEKDLFISADINISLHEPHSQHYGYDVSEKIFKIGCSGGFILSDSVLGVRQLFPDLPIFTSPLSLDDKIDYYLSKPKERVEIARHIQREIYRKHTYLHRAKDLLESVDLETDSIDAILEKLS